MKAFRKKSLIILVSLAFAIAPTVQSNAQILDIINAVINAIDLKIQKAQNAIIDLQNAEKQLENDLSQTELGNIADWLQQQKDLYSEYFDELWKVKDVIGEFKAVTDIFDKQKQLINEYKHVYSLIQQDKNFSAREISYMYNVYTGIIDESAKSVDLISTLIQAFTVQMTDGERLKILNRCVSDVDKQISDLRTFSNQNITLSLQRAKDLNDVNTVKQLYGLQ
jgi:uncharacterized protein YfkK (UPF0435 family)